MLYCYRLLKLSTPLSVILISVFTLVDRSFSRVKRRNFTAMKSHVLYRPYYLLFMSTSMLRAVKVTSVYKSNVDLQVEIDYSMCWRVAQRRIYDRQLRRLLILNFCSSNVRLHLANVDRRYRPKFVTWEQLIIAVYCVNNVVYYSSTCEFVVLLNNSFLCSA